MNKSIFSAMFAAISCVLLLSVISIVSAQSNFSCNGTSASHVLHLNVEVMNSNNSPANFQTFFFGFPTLHLLSTDYTPIVQAGINNQPSCLVSQQRHFQLNLPDLQHGDIAQITTARTNMPYNQPVDIRVGSADLPSKSQLVFVLHDLVMQPSRGHLATINIDINANRSGHTNIKGIELYILPTSTNHDHVPTIETRPASSRDFQYQSRLYNCWEATSPCTCKHTCRFTDIQGRENHNHTLANGRILTLKDFKHTGTISLQLHGGHSTDPYTIVVRVRLQ